MYEKPFNPYRNNIAIIKEYFKSPLVLVLAIAHIVSMVISLIYNLISASATKDFLLQLSEYIDNNLVLGNADNDMGNTIVKSIRDALAQPDAATTVISIPIFTILTVVGLLLLYFSCRKNDLNSAPTAGVTILNILAILSLIGCIMAVAAMLIIAVALFFIYVTFHSQPSRAFSFKIGSTKLEINDTLLLIIAIAFTVVAVICSAVMLFYYISRKRYIGSIKKSLTSVELSRAGAKPYGVFTVIIAALLGMSLLSNIADILLNRPSQEVFNGIGITIIYDNTLLTVFTIVNQAVAFVIAVLQAKLALGYAKYIDEKRSGFNPPADRPDAIPNARPQATPYSYLAQSKTEELQQNNALKPNDIKAEANAAAQTRPKCGKPIDTGAPFCGNCGSKLS